MLRIFGSLLLVNYGFAVEIISYEFVNWTSSETPGFLPSVKYEGLTLKCRDFEYWNWATDNGLGPCNNSYFMNGERVLDNKECYNPVPSKRVSPEFLIPATTVTTLSVNF